jgi:mutator protein MutT
MMLRAARSASAAFRVLDRALVVGQHTSCAGVQSRRGQVAERSGEINDARWPVSMKGVVFIGSLVALVRNDRNEWELPGGRLEPGETPEACVVREIAEELSIAVSADELIDVWVYPVEPTKSVLIVTFGCSLVGAANLRISDEHNDLALVDVGHELDGLPMPEGYRRSIRRWAARQTP